MLDLYTWSTSNGRKVSVMLEELGLAYRVHAIDIGKGDQFTPAYVAINPNSKIPAIVDADGPDGKPITLFESGAILVYLAEKTGRFLPPGAPVGAPALRDAKVGAASAAPGPPRGRYEVFQWLMFQMGGVGPMFGQAHHFRRSAPEQVPYGIERYTKETRRLYGVIDRRLGESAYLAGDYSIADIATFPWVSRHAWQGVELSEFPSVKRWFDGIAARPAVVRGMAVPS
jgi:GST-like protein